MELGLALPQEKPLMADIALGAGIKNKQVGVVLLVEKDKPIKMGAVTAEGREIIAVAELGAEVQEVEKGRLTKTDEDNFL